MVFDLGNVILDLHFDDFAKRLSLHTDRSPKEIMEYFCTSETKYNFDRGIIAPQEFIHLSLDWLNLSDDFHEPFIKLWQNIFTPSSRCEAFFKKVNPSTHLWLMSDTDPLHFVHVVSNYEVLSRFSKFILSFVTGKLKRDAGSFRWLGDIAKENKIVFIDDMKVNIEAARSVGITSVRFSGWNELENHEALRDMLV